MTSRTFDLPQPVRLRAENLGQAGARWIAGLGECVAYLENRWSVRVGGVLTGGSESLVVEVRLDDGTPAIVKIGLPGSADLATEARVYALAAGRGYAKLIAHEPARNALLMERLGTPLARTGVSIEGQIRQICRALAHSWIPLDASCGLMTGAEKARWLAAFITEHWQLLKRPCDKQTVYQAVAFSEEREDAFSPDDSVLVHGDAHALNALTIPVTAGRDLPSCKFIDPDGLFAEPACDLAVPMREWSAELMAGDTPRLARQRCELLAELTGVDAGAIWQWGFMERVSTGLLLLHLGMRREGDEYLGVAERLCHG